MTVLPAGTAVFVRQDWDNDGTFVGTYDDVSADVLPGVSVDRGRDQGRVIGGPKVPKASWTLTNESRLYATEYSGSPLHGKLQPGHRATIGRVLGDDTVTMGSATVAMGDPDALMGGAAEVLLFTGNTDEPVEHYQLGGRTVELGAFGTTQRLINTKVTFTTTALETFTTGIAMIRILEAAGLTAADYVIDPDAIVNGYQLRHFVADDEPAWDVCRRIWATTGPPAALYEGTDGRIHFEGRNYRTLTDRCLTVQQTFSDADGAALFFVNLEYEPSNLSVINDMTVDVEQRALGTTQQVWQYGSQLTLGASETLDLIARTNDPIVEIETPDGVTDYALASGSVASIAVTTLGPYAYRIRIVAGAGGAVIDPTGTNTGIQLRAKPVPVVSRSTVMGTFDTAPSITTYGKRAAPQEISGAIWKDLSEAHAAALLDGYLVAYQAPRAVLRLRLVNATGQLLYEIMRREISDRIHISEIWSGVSLDVTIEQITHSIDGLLNHTCEFVCERVVELGWARFDVDRFDVGKYGQ